MQMKYKERLRRLERKEQATMGTHHQKSGEGMLSSQSSIDWRSDGDWRSCLSDSGDPYHW